MIDHNKHFKDRSGSWERIFSLLYSCKLQSFDTTLTTFLLQRFLVEYSRLLFQWFDRLIVPFNCLQTFLDLPFTHWKNCFRNSTSCKVNCKCNVSGKGYHMCANNIATYSRFAFWTRNTHGWKLPFIVLAIVM